MSRSPTTDIQHHEPGRTPPYVIASSDITRSHEQIVWHPRGRRRTRNIAHHVDSRACDVLWAEDELTR